MLIGLKNTFCFLDDILIVSKDSEENHIKLVTNCLKKLEADKLCMNLPNCCFAKQKFSLIGYNTSPFGMSPLESNTSAILTLQPPNTVKKLCSFRLCALH